MKILIKQSHDINRNTETEIVLPKEIENCLAALTNLFSRLGGK